MSRLEALLRLSLLRAELERIAADTDDQHLRELAEYLARLVGKAA